MKIYNTVINLGFFCENNLFLHPFVKTLNVIVYIPDILCYSWNTGRYPDPYQDLIQNFDFFTGSDNSIMADPEHRLDGQDQNWRLPYLLTGAPSILYTLCGRGLGFGGADSFGLKPSGAEEESPVAAYWPLRRRTTPANSYGYRKALIVLNG